MILEEALAEKGTSVFYRYRLAYSITGAEGVLKVPAMYQPYLTNDASPQPTLWDFGLHHIPILGGELNETLTGLFLDRFAGRRIGFGCVADFERNLRRIFNESAPIWDARLRSMMVEMPLDEISVTMTNTSTAESEDSATSSKEGTDSRTRAETVENSRDETVTGATDETTTGSTSGEEHARDVTSDFPSTMVGGDSRYPSGAQDRNALTTGTSSRSSEGTDSRTVEGSDSGSIQGSDSGETTGTETSASSSSSSQDSSSVESGRRRSVAALLEEQRAALINVQEEILDSFEILFAGSLFGGYNDCKNYDIF